MNRSNGAQLVLGALRRHADDRGEVALSLDTLGRETAYTPQGIAYRLGALIEDGAIERLAPGRDRHPARYRITLRRTDP